MLDLWGFRRGKRRQAVRSGRDEWRHADLAVRPVSIDTAKDPRYRRERSGGYGSTAPYVPNRLGLPARRTGHPPLHMPSCPAPRDRPRQSRPRNRPIVILDEVID